ncbi:MAG: hypothetical protein DWQ08_05875 [Proteobacteria bacterium]|nr:MAG: hypothetical protein DWQ08_05875 [Pseudomonadota bacterium]
MALVLVVKFAALSSLIEQGEWAAIVAAPLLARAGAQALFLTTPYVRADGLGTAIAANLDRDRVLVALIVALAVGAILIGVSAWLVLPLLVLVFYVVRAVMMRKLLGTTGDSAGGLIEILEAATLAFLA